MYIEKIEDLQELKQYKKNSREIKIDFICPICGSEHSYSLRSMLNRKELICTGCIQKRRINNYSPEKIEEINEKRRLTCEKRYGVPHISMVEDIQSRRKKTMKNKKGYFQ